MNHVGPSGLIVLLVTLTPTNGRGYWMTALRALFFLQWDPS
jgi:hypothetical protein